MSTRYAGKRRRHALAQRTHIAGRRLRWEVIAAIFFLLVVSIYLMSPHVLAQSSKQRVAVLAYEVHQGDTFSGITARFTGDPSMWRKFYDRRLSGLDDPNLIYPGTWFELVRERGRHPYLRVLKGPYQSAQSFLAQSRPGVELVVRVKPAAPLIYQPRQPTRI